MILLGIYRAVAAATRARGRPPRRSMQAQLPGGPPSNLWPAVSAPAFDLQSHSLHSDGDLPAAQVVENAADAGVELLALSDHDTVDGVDEALAAGAVHGVRVVPATEISAVDGEYEDLHVLGYGIDHRSALLGERLLDARADRERRADAMADRLRELGFEVDPAPIEARKAKGKPVGRPHLAAAVLAHPANAERLAEEGHADVSSFIPAYLIQGKPGLRCADASDRRGGDRLDPRGGRGRRLGASVLGRRRQRRGARRDLALPRVRARRGRGLLSVALRGADGAARERCPRSSGC